MSENQVAVDTFNHENRVRLWFHIKDSLSVVHSAGAMGFDVVEDVLKRQFGRLDLAKGFTVEERMKNFILSAPRDEILFLVEMTPHSYYLAKTHGHSHHNSMDRFILRDADREALEVAQGLNEFLEFLGHPARFVFEPQFEFRPDGIAMQQTTLATNLPAKETLVADLAHRFAQTTESFCLLFIDLDHFKNVNDKFGHDEGDRCLDRAVEIIAGAVLKKGQLYRCGGDEFAVLLPNFTRTEAQATAERIRSSIEHGNPGGRVKVTTSIGVACSDAFNDPEAILKAADGAMYTSKRTRNAVTVA